jgi:predicted RNA polymerase sigma factor
MKNKDIPCCAADAMRRVKAVDVNGATVGLAMLDLVFDEVRAMGRMEETAVRAELLKRVKIYNYIPPPAADAYAAAVFRDYVKWANEGGIR